jgi:methylated-DNA-[protein]-cysteine S-methyltransferase
MAGPSATARIASPIGMIAVTADDDTLTGLRIEGAGAASTSDHPILVAAQAQLEDWFSGKRTGFDLPIPPLDSDEGETLRAGIAAIPYGQTATYGDVATATASAARAVGQACRTNALPIIIPCHRVISADGRAFYSAGDGARTKGWLLDFERANLPPEQRNTLL